MIDVYIAIPILLRRHCMKYFTYTDMNLFTSKDNDSNLLKKALHKYMFHRI